MKRSTSYNKRNTSIVKALAIAFWLIVWQLMSMYVGQEILLVSPVSTCKAFLQLCGNEKYYQAILGSFGRILLGFSLGTLLGLALAALSYAFEAVHVLLAPLMTVIKATPVASFVILALIWISSRNLSVLMSFLMVLPITYSNALQGLNEADPKLRELARIFRMRPLNRVRAILAPAVFPYLIAAARLSLGMCWKAGIAAEVIGQPRNSIGSALQQAKVYFNTPELFAWTLTIIILSLAFEKLVLFLAGRMQKRGG